MDTLTVSVTDGVARIQIAADWLWVLAAIGWLGLYSIWCEVGEWVASVRAAVRRPRWTGRAL